VTNARTKRQEQIVIKAPEPAHRHAGRSRIIRRRNPGPPKEITMKKIALNIETLAVESFEAGSEPVARGTVQANEANLATRGQSCYRTYCCPETTLC
jgi:hypothetical protein